MRILITGGAGYIGSAIAALLIARGHQPVILDNLSQGHLDSLAPGTPTIVADLGDRHALEEVFTQHAIEAVIHLAAVSVVGDSMNQPLRYYRENVGGLLNLLVAMRVAGVNTLVFSSSAAVYGVPDQTPVTEKCAPRPINPYGWTKFIGEKIITDTASAHGLHFVSLRYFNVAGADGLCGEAHSPETHLIPRVLEVAAGQRPHIEIYGTSYDTPDGTCIRDYVHIAEVAEAHVLALDAAPQLCTAFNLGNNFGYSVREVIACAEKVTGKHIPCVDLPPRAGDASRLVAAYDKIKAELSWQPRRSLEEIISSAWQWRQRFPSGYSK